MNNNQKRVICLTCGRVVDLYCAESNVCSDFFFGYKAEHGLYKLSDTVSDSAGSVYGYCSKCKKQNEYYKIYKTDELKKARAIKREELYEKIDKWLEDHEFPGWILSARKNYVTVSAGSWDGSHKVKVTLQALVEFYVSQAGNLSSGCRTLAGFTSDWRGVSNLADICLDYFKAVNIEGLKAAGYKRGLILKSLERGY